MHIGVVTLFPEMFDAVRCCGITRRALEQGIIALDTWNPRDWADDRHRTVDDRPYGGGPGMVMRVHPLHDTIVAAREAMGGSGVTTVYMSPQGRRLDQAGVEYLAAMPRLLLVAGRYEGVDERIIEATVDEEWSLGDYVLSGGELAAMVVIDAVTRLRPGALGHEDSARQDSFAAGLLDCPHYSRPEEALGRRVPPVLLEGNHGDIARWRLKQALGRTWRRRPDLLAGRVLDAEQLALLDEFIREAEDGSL
ncbi:MAG: tRNA (guanosine(37)-N1)-methyltransferase TrmD [Gammaproteobacteria bacterium]|nr:tRNA (guanosine(37)-N1)-methyltransferase TrmD [Gammaproteobacteria bacterium]